MIEFIHKYPILIKVLLTITTVAFVATGGFLLGTDTAQLAAKVEDENITMQEYQQAVYNLESFYRKVFQGNVPEDFFRDQRLDKMALDQLVDRKVMLIGAERLELGVGDDEIAKAVRNNASFHGQDGAFSKSVYTEVLRMNNMSPQEYEESVRQDLAVEKFRKFVQDSVVVTDDDIRRYFTEQREAQGLAFDEQAFNENKESLAMSLMSMHREKALREALDGLKKELEIKYYTGEDAAG